MINSYFSSLTDDPRESYTEGSLEAVSSLQDLSSLLQKEGIDIYEYVCIDR